MMIHSYIVLSNYDGDFLGSGKFGIVVIDCSDSSIEFVIISVDTIDSEVNSRIRFQQVKRQLQLWFVH